MNERKQRGGVGPGLQQQDDGDVVHSGEATTGINQLDVWIFATVLLRWQSEQAGTLARTACLEQLGCSGTFLNHGLGKPPRLRVLAIGSMRRAASWSRASSEAPFPRALEVGSAVLDLQGPRDVIKSRVCQCAPGGMIERSSPVDCG